MEKDKPKSNQILDESVKYSFALELYDSDSRNYIDLDHISEIVSFQDFVQKLYLFHNFCSETKRSYFISLSNSPSINPKKNQDDEVPF